MKEFKGKIRAALGPLMEHAPTAASTTKAPTAAAAVADRALLSAIEAAVERFTDAGHDAPAGDDRHVHEILFLVSNAPGAITFLARRITARLEAGRGRGAAAATPLRSLLLVHRLLRGGDRYFEQDLRGLWSSGDLRLGVAGAAGAATFLQDYSAYLEERMNWVITHGGNLEPIKSSPPPSHAMAAASYEEDVAETLLFKLAMSQRLLDHAIQLLPDNNAGASAAARSAFGIVLRESFRVHDAFQEGLDVVLRSRSLYALSKALMVSAHEILRKACAQTPELKELYHKCKRSNASNVSSEYYPTVRVVTPSLAAAVEVVLSCPQDREVAQASAAPFARKLETTVSTVWVEFDDDGGGGDGNDHL